MPDIQIRVENIEAIRGAFAQFPDTIAPFLRTASMQSALTIERAAKILTPVDTGRLRASINTSLGVLDRGITSIVATNVFYAVYVHEGTRRTRGRPFMRQAAEQNAQAISDIFNDQTKRALSHLATVAQ